MSTAAAEVTVSTAAATAASTKCHMFKIEGYTRIKTIYGTGKSVDSCGFQAAGRTWKIQFFPDGDKPENRGYASLCLKLDDADAGNDDRNVLVEFQVSLVCHRCKPSRRPYSRTCTATFRKGRSAAGFWQFVKQEELEKSGFLRDDCLAIRCDMAVLNNPVDVKQQAAQAQDLERLGVVCDCRDDSCKSYHLRPGAACSFREALVKLFLGCFHL